MDVAEGKGIVGIELGRFWNEGGGGEIWLKELERERGELEE